MLGEQRRAARLGRVARNRSRHWSRARHARSRASMPNGRAGFVPTGTNMARPRRRVMRAAHKGGESGQERALSALRLAALAHFAHQSALQWPITTRQTGTTSKAARLGLPRRRRADDHARGDDPARDRCAARPADHRPVRNRAHGHGRRVDRSTAPSATAAPRSIGASRDEVSLLEAGRRVRRSRRGSAPRSGRASSAC